MKRLALSVCAVIVAIFSSTYAITPVHANAAVPEGYEYINYDTDNEFYFRMKQLRHADLSFF